MKYNPFKLYIARIKEGIIFRILISVVVFGVGSVNSLVITNVTTGEAILTSHLLSGLVTLLPVLILFAILRSILVGFTVWGCYYGHTGLQQTYKEFVGNDHG